MLVKYNRGTYLLRKFDLTRIGTLFITSRTIPSRLQYQLSRRLDTAMSKSLRKRLHSVQVEARTKLIYSFCKRNVVVVHLNILFEEIQWINKKNIVSWAWALCMEK